MKKIWSNIRAFGLQIAVAVNLLTFMGLLFTGYSGYIDPTEMPFAALAGMSYCLWVVLAFVLMLMDILLCRRLILIPVTGILLTIGPLLTYSPINFAKTGMDEADSCRTFSVLTYNVCGYADGSNLGQPVDSNLTVDYIIHSGADVVCVQEGRLLQDQNTWLAVSSEMADTLNMLYPYHESDTTRLTVYSRYPLTSEMLPLSKIGWGSFAKYHLTIHGQHIILYNVHMQSTGLSPDDREYYRDLTMKPRDARIGQMRQRLIHTLYEGYAVRAVQVRVLAGYVGNDMGTV
ncbi:MAG: hypothetical protein K2M76_00600, partial [Muribaculaceae bacterium]|nr:hypothetical protein [Muribaculaceae bacterium]